MAKNRWQHALVIGASSGIGEALARRLAASGVCVALVARRATELERIAEEINRESDDQRAWVFTHDVADVDAVPELLQTISRELGGLDLVIYAAGLMHPVAFDEFDHSKDVPMIETNLTGAIAWLGCTAERFARLGAGTIVGIGSVAGDRGRCGNPAYHAAKAGLHTYLESLRNRVSRFGVRVVTIKPGFVDTPMTQGLSGLFWLISADRAAEIILSKARKRTQTAYVPARWRVVMWIIRSIPSFIFRRLKV